VTYSRRMFRLEWDLTLGQPASIKDSKVHEGKPIAKDCSDQRPHAAGVPSVDRTGSRQFPF
jgi:hypothetical protein